MKSVHIYDVVNSLPTRQNIYYRQRNIHSDLTVVFHHSAVFKCNIKAIAHYHINSKNFPGIGYHFMLNYDEKIYLTNYLNTTSWHTGNTNSKTIGVCFNSNFNVIPPGPKMIQMAYDVLLFLEQYYSIKTFTFHNELNKTDCPGKLFDKIKFTDQYNNFRKQLDPALHYNFRVLNSSL